MLEARAVDIVMVDLARVGGADDVPGAGGLELRWLVREHPSRATPSIAKQNQVVVIVVGAQLGDMGRALLCCSIRKAYAVAVRHLRGSTREIHLKTRTYTYGFFGCRDQAEGFVIVAAR